MCTAQQNVLFWQRTRSRLYPLRMKKFERIYSSPILSKRSFGITLRKVECGCKRVWHGFCKMVDVCV